MATVSAGWRRRAPRAALAVWIACAAALLHGFAATAAARSDPPATVQAAPAPAGRAPQLSTQQVLRRSLRAEPDQEYFLYIPGRGGQGAPLFVAVHGISRNAPEHAGLFADYAEKHGVVLLAPYFTASGNDDYQRLGRAGRGPRADLALDRMIDEAGELTGATTGKIYLFGFSGGAQFAHRYAMAHPDRIERVVVAAAGWYTFPDAAVAYPYGIGPSPDFRDVRFDPDRFLRVPIAVFVGEDDVGDENVRRNPDVDRQQGVTRLERARNWVAAMRAAAAARGIEPRIEFESVPGIHHSFAQFMREGGLGDRVFAALFGPAAVQPAGGMAGRAP
jgi:pimeloyl-ACP methyl ester carboxylesterase